MGDILYTKNGHNMYDMSSLLQKAIRRGHAVYAGYAANELMGRYNSYLWKRLLTISAEDCWGCVTAEIIALKNADDIHNAQCRGYDRNPLFVGKAVTLLLKVRKNRDADYFCCNLLNSEDTIDLAQCEREFDRIPEYTYDCHTMRGKLQGKTKADMIRTEQAALNPHEPGDFDNESWDRFFQLEKRGFDKEKGYPMPTKEQLKSLEDGQTSLF